MALLTVAVANALFSLTGARARRLPLKHTGFLNGTRLRPAPLRSPRPKDAAVPRQTLRLLAAGGDVT